MQNHTNVIRFPEPSRWSFHDYVEGGINRIEEWYVGLSQEAKDGFNALLKNTQKIENHLHWGGFKFLKGEAKNQRLWQLDFIADKRQYRIVGVFGLGRKQAALILGCYHKGPNYTPRDAIRIACERAKSLSEGKARTNERPITEDI